MRKRKQLIAMINEVILFKVLKLLLMLLNGVWKKEFVRLLMVEQEVIFQMYVWAKEKVLMVIFEDMLNNAVLVKWLTHKVFNLAYKGSIPLHSTI